jgi:hypothetical protein
MPDSSPLAIKKALFTLYYRQGMNPHPQFLFFEGSGPFPGIISRAKSFCETMNYRFVHCRPTIVNLDEEEKRRVGSDIQ